MSESTLETLLTAEPQALMVVAESGEAELLVASLPAALGVPRDAGTLLNFAGWLDAASAQDLDHAIDALAERGEPFNLMLRTQRNRYVEVDGRTTGRTIVFKVRDLAGQRLDLADAAAKQRQLEDQIASLRASARRGASIRASAAPRPSRAWKPASGASTGSPPPLPYSTQASGSRISIRPMSSSGSSSRNGWARIRATARFSIACARRGGCPRRPIIATGRRAGSPVTAPMRRPRTSGTCRTAARCMSSPTARARRA